VKGVNRKFFLKYNFMGGRSFHVRCLGRYSCRYIIDAPRRV